MKIMSKLSCLRVMRIFIFVFIFWGGIINVSATDEEKQPHYPGDDQWSLVFEDDFDGTEVDSTKWSIRGKESYIYHDASCVSVNNGNLLLKIDREPSGQVILGRIDTTNTQQVIENEESKYSQKYGFFECRAKIPPVNGTYFAFWLQRLGGTEVLGTGRDGAEIDVCETIFQDNHTESTIHYDGYGSHHKKVSSGKRYAPNIHNGYHIYGLEWDERTLKFYFDGQLTWIYTGEAIPRVEEFLILSSGYDSTTLGLWVDGSINNAQLPYYSQVDWIRAYTKDVPDHPVLKNADFSTGNAEYWNTNGSATVVSNGTGGYAAKLTTNGWFEQYVTNLKPNTNYRLKAKVKTNTFPRFLVKDFGGNDVGVMESNTNGAYEEHYLDFTTGNNNTTARVCFYHWYSDGESLVDEFQVVEIAPGAVINNAGFESGIFAGWETNGSAAVTQNGKTGMYAARLTTNGWFEQTVTGLKPSTNYRMKVWVKTNGIAKFVVKHHGNPDVSVPRGNTNGQYVEHYVDFTTGSNNTSARLCYYHWNYDGESFADDFRIEER